MSGTYRIDGDLFITNPLRKKWSRRNIGATPAGKPIPSQLWSLDFSFSEMRAGSGTASSYLMEKWLSDGLHTAVLPHPLTGDLALFSGVAIEQVNFTFTDKDQDKWAGNARMQLSHISLTNSWNFP